MPWNRLVGAGNTGYVVRGDHSDENNIKRGEDTSHRQSKKESSGCQEEAAPGSQGGTEMLIFKDDQEVWKVFKGHVYKRN